MNRRHLLASTFAALALVAVAFAPVSVAQPPNAAAAVTGVYTYPGPGTVNTHWIETPGGGLVVVDVQRDLAHARRALAAVRATGKPVRAILVTHGHPDHYTGLGLFMAAFPNAEVWSSTTTRDTIRDDPYGFNKLVQELYGRDAPSEFRLPTNVFNSDATLTIDGLTIVAREMGPAEANSATAYYVPATGDLYVGDLVLNRLHGLFGEAKTTEWLAALDRLAVLFPQARVVHPGHGASGSAADLFGAQRDYIVSARAIAASELARSGNTPEARERVAAAIRTRFPYENPAGLRDIIGISVDGLFRELTTPALTPLN